MLFADGTPDQGILHMDFRISADGEELGLVQLIGLDTVWLDHVVFGTLSQGNSLSRIDDGGLMWTQQAPTPGYSNHSTGLLSQQDLQVTIYPNPASNSIHIHLGKVVSGEIDVQVVNMLGEVDILTTGVYSESGQEIILDISHLEPGIYLVMVQIAGERSVHRIIKTR